MCPSCTGPIQGAYLETIVIGLDIPTPVHCIHCGQAYPWKAKLTKLQKKSKKSEFSLGEWFKKTAVGGVIIGGFWFLNQTFDLWNKVLEPARNWVYKQIPELSIKWSHDKSPEPTPKK